MKQAGTSHTTLADGLGSTMAVVDSSGNSQKSYTYDVYGEATPSGGRANEFDFAGQQTDATGLQYLRARYYDPETGTFLSREPMSNVPSWLGNPSVFSRDNPARFVDPSGLFAVGGGDSSCGGGCLETNDIIPHSGGWFREYKGRTQWCVGFAWCEDVEAERFSEVKCRTNLLLQNVICENAFGGILSVTSFSDGDSASQESAEQMLKWCAGGFVVGLIGGGPPGALGGCAASAGGGALLQDWIEAGLGRVLD